MSPIFNPGPGPVCPCRAFGGLCRTPDACRSIGMPAAPAPEPPGPPARVSGKVLGFRCWTLEGYRLLSVNPAFRAWWTVGENRAKCLASPDWEGVHEAPHHACQCGLYAWHLPGSLLIPHGDGLVYGAVLAWGRMEVHAAGFRAEFAEPVMLAYHPRQAYEDVRRAETIASEMALPFVTVEELATRATEFGEPVPEDLRPEAPYFGGAYFAIGSSAGLALPPGATTMFAPMPPPPRRRPP